MKRMDEYLCNEVPSIEAGCSYSTKYKGYIEKQRDRMPGKRPIGRTLLYSIAKHTTGGAPMIEAPASQYIEGFKVYQNHWRKLGGKYALTLPCCISVTMT